MLCFMCNVCHVSYVPLSMHGMSCSLCVMCLVFVLLDVCFVLCVSCFMSVMFYVCHVLAIYQWSVVRGRMSCRTCVVHVVRPLYARSAMSSCVMYYSDTGCHVSD